MVQLGRGWHRPVVTFLPRPSGECLQVQHDFAGLACTLRGGQDKAQFPRQHQHGPVSSDHGAHQALRQVKQQVHRLLVDLDCSLGIIPLSRMVEVDRSGLVAGYVGRYALKTRAVVQSALGGRLL
jgi:hypothetical protein